MIEKAEEKWLDQLYTYCESIFSNTKITSHDHNHHYRVWEYCKEILAALYQNYNMNDDLVEGCMIASFFHDTGLSKTLDEFHGEESKKICSHFFKNQNIDRPTNFNEILWAIEKHDDKNYLSEKQNPDSLLSIICNADDLDAFGRIGIIRYTEIYLVRGLTLNELPLAVIKNLEKRFTHFKNTYQDYPELIKQHESRYLITKNFFEKMQKEFI